MKLKIAILTMLFSASSVFAHDQNIIKAIRDSQLKTLEQELSDKVISRQDKEYYIKLATDVSETARYKFQINYIKNNTKPRPNINDSDVLKAIGCLLLGCGSILATDEKKGGELHPLPAYLIASVSFYFAYQYFLKIKKLTNAQLKNMRTYEQIYLESREVVALLKKI